MNVRTYILLACLWSVTALIAADATNTVPELSTLQQRYQPSLDQVAVERAERFQSLQAGYLRALEELRRSLAAQGNLDAVLAVKAEQERVTKWVELSDEQKKQMPPALLQHRRQYEQNFARIIQEQQQKTDGIRQVYARDLDALQRTLTQQDRISAALAVKAEKDRVLANLPVTAEAKLPSLTAPAKALDWEALVFPKNSDWPGPRGEKARISGDEVVVQGRPVRTKQTFAAPVSFACEVVLDHVTGHDGGFTVAFVSEESPSDMEPKVAVMVALGYSQRDGTGGSLTLIDSQRQTTSLTKRPFAIEANKPYRLKVEMLRDRIRITLDDETFERQNVALPAGRCYVWLMGWQPVNEWRCRKTTCR